MDKGNRSSRMDNLQPSIYRPHMDQTSNNHMDNRLHLDQINNNHLASRPHMDNRPYMDQINNNHMDNHLHLDNPSMVGHPHLRSRNRRLLCAGYGLRWASLEACWCLAALVV
jgi:hypothetical protein